MRAAQLHHLLTHPSAACRRCKAPGLSGRPLARCRTGSFPGCSPLCAPCKQRQKCTASHREPTAHGARPEKHNRCSRGAGMQCAAHVAKRPSRSTAVVPTTTSSLSPISLLYRCRQAVQGGSPVHPSAQDWKTGGQRTPAAAGHRPAAAAAICSYRQRQLTAPPQSSRPRHLRAALM